MSVAMARVLLGCAAGLGLAQPSVADVYGDPATPVAGQVYDTVIHTNDAEELRYVVLKALTDRYADEKGIRVSDAEIDAYLARMAADMAQDRREHEARRDELARRLTATDLPQAKREELESELESVNELLATLAPETGESAESRQEIAAAHREIAGAFILQWKINRALYEQYGGRIIFQQGGPEPLDAYRQFLEEREERGDFAIRNEQLAVDFWSYYRNDGLHSFYEPGSREEKQAFGSPWWQAP
jgi:hypothetical protein